MSWYKYAKLKVAWDKKIQSNVLFSNICIQWLYLNIIFVKLDIQILNWKINTILFYFKKIMVSLMFVTDRDVALDILKCALYGNRKCK